MNLPSKNSRSLAPIVEDGLALESTTINRGLQILEDMEPIPVLPAEVLLFNSGVIVIEEPSTSVGGGGWGLELQRYREFYAHVFTRGKHEYQRTFRCRLTDLIGLRDQEGRLSSRTYEIIDNKLLVHEYLYHGKAFAEHVFDLHGNLHCILTDDLDLKRRNPTLITSVVPVPAGNSEFWTVPLGWGKTRFSDVTNGLQYFRSSPSGRATILYDRKALLHRLGLLEPRSEHWPYPIEVYSDDHVIPDSSGIWMWDGDGSMRFVSATPNGLDFQNAVKGRMDLENSPTFAIHTRGGINEVLFVEAPFSDFDQGNFDSLSRPRFVTYCWVENGSIFTLRNIDLLASISEHADVTVEDISSLFITNVWDGTISFTIHFFVGSEFFLDQAVGLIDPRNGSAKLLFPSVPKKWSAEGNYPSMVETNNEGEIIQFIPDKFTRLESGKRIYRVGDTVPKPSREH